jgi:hypothetical protein
VLFESHAEDTKQKIDDKEARIKVPGYTLSILAIIAAGIAQIL